MNLVFDKEFISVMEEPNESSYVMDGRVNKMLSLPRRVDLPEACNFDSTGIDCSGDFYHQSPSTSLFMLPQVPALPMDRWDRTILYDYLQIRGSIWFPTTDNGYDYQLMQTVDIIVVYDRFPHVDSSIVQNVKPAISDIYKPRYGNPGDVMSLAFKNMVNSERFIEVDRKSFRLMSYYDYEQDEGPPVIWPHTELQNYCLDYYVDLRGYKTQFSMNAAAGPGTACVANGNLYLVFLGEDEVRSTWLRPQYSIYYNCYYYNSNDVCKYLNKSC